MPEIKILKPTDQPLGNSRLLDEIKQNFANQEIKSFRFITAFAKLGPLTRLDSDIQKWKKSGKTIHGIFGIDQKGTSKEALEYAISNFDQSYVFHLPGKFSATFHPKIYLFEGDQKVIGYVGSNNLTVGGTETNFESYIRLIISLPGEQKIYNELLSSWNESIKYSLPLDTSLLTKLTKADLVQLESTMRKSNRGSSSGNNKPMQKIGFPKIITTPPSPIPKKFTVRKKASKKTSVANQPVTFSLPATAFAIQVVPHHNGEVFLSKTAIDQNPSFFGWPFTGSTTPKKPSNPSYPQRLPDPVVNLILYDTSGKKTIEHLNFGLNTVYYKPKSEIRITVPQDIVQATSPYKNGPYPVMVIIESNTSQNLDYEIDIYLPGSNDYNNFVTACNQTMPSGGKPIARKFGWF